MLFKRKKKLSQFEKLKNFLFPPKGIIRGYKYILKRLFRLNGSPHSIALGAAFGIAIAMTPFFGLQLILTFIFDFIFKANITASLISSIIGNPLTFPFIWISGYKLGNFILSNENIDNTSFLTSIEQIKEAFQTSNWNLIENSALAILTPMTIGGLLLGFIFGIITYIFTIKAIKKYKLQKQEKLKVKVIKK